MDISTVAQVANFSWRLQEDFSCSTSGQTFTMLSTDQSDYITMLSAVTAQTIVLPPILNTFRDIKIDASGISGSTITLTPGTNPDSFGVDTISGAASYSLTSGRAILLKSTIGHDWTVYTV